MLAPLAAFRLKALCVSLAGLSFFAFSKAPAQAVPFVNTNKTELLPAIEQMDKDTFLPEIQNGIVSRFATVVLKNGAVCTMDAARRWCQAIAVRDSRIVFVGSDLDVKRLIGEKTKVVDLNGRMLSLIHI